MKKFTIRRRYEPYGTPGSMFDEAGLRVCYTIECAHARFGGYHPCIPEGSYIAHRYSQGKHGAGIWMLQNVPNRIEIEFHVANWPHELLGCIAPGMSPATGRNGEPGVSKSVTAFYKFMGRTAEDEEIGFDFTAA